MERGARSFQRDNSGAKELQTPERPDAEAMQKKVEFYTQKANENPGDYIRSIHRDIEAAKSGTADPAEFSFDAGWTTEDFDQLLETVLTNVPEARERLEAKNKLDDTTREGIDQVKDIPGAGDVLFDGNGVFHLSSGDKSYKFETTGTGSWYVTNTSTGERNAVTTALLSTYIMDRI
jgi:hypothetical protein